MALALHSLVRAPRDMMNLDIGFMVERPVLRHSPIVMTIGGTVVTTAVRTFTTTTMTLQYVQLAISTTTTTNNTTRRIRRKRWTNRSWMSARSSRIMARSKAAHMTPCARSIFLRSGAFADLPRTALVGIGSLDDRDLGIFALAARAGEKARKVIMPVGFPFSARASQAARARARTWAVILEALMARS